MAPKSQSTSSEATLQEILTKLNTILDNQSSFDKRILSIEESIQGFAKVKCEIDQIKAENRSLRECIADLKKENRKSALRKNLKKIQIAGVPKTDGESPLQMVVHLGSFAGVPIKEANIKDIYRQNGRYGKPGNIIATLESINQRNMLLKALKGKKITTNDLKAKGENNVVFVNAPLTPENKRVLYQAKQIMGIKGWFRVWVFGAEVYIKQEENGKAIKVETLDDLNILIR